MSFKLDFEICQSDCETLTFNDQTGRYIKGVSECCKTGYDYSNNPTPGDVVSSLFTIIYPNGTTVYEDVDLGYLPTVYACGSFEILSVGPYASVALVADGSMIGSAELNLALLITYQEHQ